MDTRPRELALFAGAGGGLLGSKWLLGHRIVCYVEWNKYRQQVIQARIGDGLLDDAPIWDDVQTFDGTAWRGRVDIVSGGFPCQPFSVAGKQLGAADKRNMWPDTIRIIREVRPRIAFLENVPGLLSNGYFGTVLGDLAEAGYFAEWGVFSAAEVGAPHRRERLFILAYTNKDGCVRSSSKGSILQGELSEIQEQQRRGGTGSVEGRGTHVAHSLPCRCNGGPNIQGQGPARRGRVGEDSEDVADSGIEPRDGWCSRPSWWEREPLEAVQDAREGRGQEAWLSIPESLLGRVANGVASRVDRLSALGDGQVPLTMAYAYATLFKRAFGG